MFDEINSLIKHDIQDEEFKLGLKRKNFSLIQSSMIDNGKAPEGEPSPEYDNVKGEQVAYQSGGSNAEPNLGQNQSIQLDSSRTDFGTDSRKDLELISPHTQERSESMYVDSIIPRPWKH